MTTHPHRLISFTARSGLLPGAPGELAMVRQWRCCRTTCGECFARGLWSFWWSLIGHRLAAQEDR